MSEKSAFERLAAIDVSAHIEKKNGLSYLSWAWAVDQLLRADPTATWRFGKPEPIGETLMVFCHVTAFGKVMSMQLPVMDYRNKAIPNPDAFQVNTAMMRCLVKAIALHGLGLYIYAGDDLPQQDDDKVVSKRTHKPTDDEVYKPSDEEVEFLQEVVDTVMAFEDLEEASKFLHNAKLDNDEKVWVWNKLPSKIRSYIKKQKG